MKLKALFIAVAVAGFSASFALADGGGGQSKSDSTSGTTSTSTSTEHHDGNKNDGCQRLELRGTFVSGSGTSFIMNVVKANDAGQAYVGKPATIGIDPKTRVRWEGRGTISGPNAGDRVNVQASMCASAGAAGAAASSAIVARHVDARADNGEHGDKSKGDQPPAPAPPAVKP